MDQTSIGDLVITVAHRLDSLESGRTRVTYAVEAKGPEAAEIGRSISADFPDVLAALVQLAEARSIKNPASEH